MKTARRKSFAPRRIAVEVDKGQTIKASEVGSRWMLRLLIQGCGLLGLCVDKRNTKKGWVRGSLYTSTAVEGTM